MHGNAAEWTADCWHPNYLGAPPRAVRSAVRVGRQADERHLDVGFRVLRELRNVDAWRGG